MSARDAEDVVNVAFDQWDQYATAVAAERVTGMTFGAFVRARLRAAGYEIVKPDEFERGVLLATTDKIAALQAEVDRLVSHARTLENTVRILQSTSKEQP